MVAAPATRITVVATTVILAALAPSGTNPSPVTAAAPPIVGQIDLTGPVGSEEFGENVWVLSNGNYVVVDERFDDSGTADVGAVYLYDGVTNTVVSTLTGTTTDDRVGSGGVVEVGDDSFVVISPYWDVGGITDAGAVTWVDGTIGLTGPVTAGNSLHGTTHRERVGLDETVTTVTALANGNYVVASPAWDNGTIVDAGAVTWADGATGLTGPITAGNSLHGTTTADRVGRYVTALTNGNYVVASPNWNNGPIADAGAATWADGTTGLTGPVTTTNSLHGTTSDDRVGGSVTALANGNYVVTSPNWDNGPIEDVGAATWADGTTGITGLVTTTNSLHGTSPHDRVGHYGPIIALANGNYVVAGPAWDHGPITDAGAVTWADGTTGLTGPVTTTNSLHGTSPDDRVGWFVAALTNGNYVVTSWEWDNATTTDAGAVTWADGTSGITGPVTTTNSLHGTSPDDYVGGYRRVTVLANGNYVVASYGWDNGAIVNAGAVTWADGTIGITGPVTTTNSLHGTTTNDYLGRHAMALTNGNYVVASADWDNGAIVDAGAVTWADGTIGITGPVTTTNSLHGTTAGDRVGLDDTIDVGEPPVSPIPLADGNYVVVSPRWDNGPIVDAGAVTWADGTTGLTGPVTTTNSLHGTNDHEKVGRACFMLDAPAPVCRYGDGGVTALSNGGYALTTPIWPPPESPGSDVPNVPGAVTYGPASGGVTGSISSANSVIGTPPGLLSPPGPTVTSGNAVVVPTGQDRVLVMLLDPEDAPGDVTAVTPERILETRDEPGYTTTDGEFQATGRLTAGTELALDVAGRGGIPTNATAAFLNITAIHPDAPGHLTVYPCGTPRPTTSNVNYLPGDVAPNAVLAKIGTNGQVCIWTLATTDLITDTAGYIPQHGATTPIEPERVLETRDQPGYTTTDGEFQATGRLTAGTELALDVAGRGGIPTNATAAFLNITAILPDAPGHLTVYPCGTPRPTTSNVNYLPGDVAPNAVLAKIGTNGQICIWTLATTDLITDTAGYTID